jgi:hypothetical protein
MLLLSTQILVAELHSASTGKIEVADYLVKD